MREFARLPTRVPPANEAANFARLAGSHIAWGIYFAWLSLSLSVEAAALKLWTWLVLAPVYWGELLAFVVTLAFVFFFVVFS